MRARYLFRTLLGVLCLLVGTASAQGEVLKPYVLGNAVPGDLDQVVEKVKSALAAKGFQIVGNYSPYPGAVVICATSDALKAAAAKAENGGFGVVQRVGVTKVQGKIQVAYVNPTYLGVAYRMGRLQGVAAKLKDALGAVQTFGSENGIEAETLAKYHYGMFMPYFENVDLIKEFSDYKTAIDAIEKNLAKGSGGTKKVYRVDLPGKNVTVFGVGIPVGDGLDKGNKDTDAEIMAIIDYKSLKHTPYLPYEMMVVNGRVIALPARYRIALHFPDTKMMGEHGFTKIMSAPFGILVVLEQATGFKRF